MLTEEQRKSYWGKERNAKRREKYASDPEYAEARRKKSRTSSDEPNPTCLGNLVKVATGGSMLAVSAYGSPLVIGRVFMQKDVGLLLNRQPTIVYRWVASKMLPAPVLQDDKGNVYYADDEVREFILAMGEHQQSTPHYRTDHDETRSRLFERSFQGNPERARAWIEARK